MSSDVTAPEKGGDSVMKRPLPDYVQTMTVTDSNGQVRELIFPKGLDLDRPKRSRTTFTNEQLALLDRHFKKNAYLVGRERAALAEELGLSETQVKVWYQNRRTKDKRDREKEPETPLLPTLVPNLNPPLLRQPLHLFPSTTASSTLHSAGLHFSHPAPGLTLPSYSNSAISTPPQISHYGLQNFQPTQQTPKERDLRNEEQRQTSATCAEFTPHRSSVFSFAPSVNTTNVTSTGSKVADMFPSFSTYRCQAQIYQTKLTQIKSRVSDVSSNSEVKSSISDSYSDDMIQGETSVKDTTNLLNMTLPNSETALVPEFSSIDQKSTAESSNPGPFRSAEVETSVVNVSPTSTVASVKTGHFPRPMFPGFFFPRPSMPYHPFGGAFASPHFSGMGYMSPGHYPLLPRPIKPDYPTEDASMWLPTS